MRTSFLLSFLILSLAFTACSNECELLIDEQTQTRAIKTVANDEKFEFGKMYSIYNIPEDAYNYIPKDSIELLIFMQEIHGDSIAFYKGGYKETAMNAGLQSANSYNVYFSTYLGSYSDFLNLTWFSLEAGAAYSPASIGIPPKSNLAIGFYSYNSPLTLKIKIEKNNSPVYFNPCIGSPRPHTAVPCKEGYVCNLNVSGRIMKISTLVNFHSEEPLYKFQYSGQITSLGGDYDLISGSISKI